MQTRYCDENSVCPSVRLSHACIVRQKLHGVTSSVSWGIVSEEVSCYGTNRRQKVLTEQDVTVISTINFYHHNHHHDADIYNAPITTKQEHRCNTKIQIVVDETY